MEEGDVMNDLEAIASAVKECRPQAPSTKPPTKISEKEVVLLIAILFAVIIELLG